MPMTLYTEDEVHNLHSLNRTLNERVNALEALRPLWTMGTTMHDQDAYTAKAALATIWLTLGVTDQTGCMQVLTDLKNRNYI